MSSESPSSPAAGGPVIQTDTSLKAETLLIEEFKRASDNLQQVRQERGNLLAFILAFWAHPWCSPLGCLPYTLNSTI